MTSDRSSFGAMFEGGAPTRSTRRGAVLNRQLHERLLGESDSPAVQLGRYSLVERIGSGGMGAVYLAKDAALGRHVAVKVLHTGFAASTGLLVAEGRALARLQHENVVEIFDVGLDPADGSTVFIAMEYVRGFDLAAWLRNEPPHTEILRAFIRAGRGLAAAHAAGLVHGDFKPSNVLRGNGGDIKVIDFGVARLFEQARVTQRVAEAGASPRAGGGTLGYCAPEKLSGGAETPASDVFSFCVALHEALSGDLPFAASDVSTFMASMRLGPRLPLPRALPSSLRRAVARGLHPDPRLRWPDMRSLVALLERYEKPERRRRAGWGVAGVAALGLTAWSLAAPNRPIACEDQAAPTRLVWASRREETRAAFASAREPYVARGGEKVLENLDRYVGELAAAQVVVCEAASRGTLAPQIASARRRCLGERSQELERFVGTLRDAQGQQAAIAGSYALTRIEPCLGAQPEADIPAGLRDDVADLEARIDGLALALEGSGFTEEGTAEAAVLVALARAIGYPPVLVRTLTLHGKFRMTAGDADGARVAWEEAYFVAQREGMAVKSLELATGLVSASTASGRYDDAWVWVRHARAAAEPTQDPLAATMVDYAESTLLLKLQRPGEALEMLERTVQTRSSILGPDHPSVGDAYLELGNTHLALAEYDRALEMLQHARAVHEAALGSRHPDLAIEDNNIGAVQFYLGQPDAAAQTWLRALSIRDESLGENHIDQFGTLENLAKVAVANGELDEGLSYVNRALRVWDVAGRGDDHPDLVGALEVLGTIHLERGRLEDARDAFDRALEICDATYDGVEVPTLGPLAGAARAAWALGDAEATVRYAQRFLGSGGPALFGQETSAGVLWVAAQAQWATGERDGSKRSAARALEAYRSLENAEATEAIVQWLHSRDV
ncbi:MAG: serine/threonine-protein kinase [Nannocystaceae bacterium]|nr:serine/threonine-protein kinase [bacterium]